MNEKEIDIEEIVSLHKELWDKTTEKIDINKNGNLDIAKIVYSECCAYLRGQMVNLEKNRREENKRREEQEKFDAVFNKKQEKTSKEPQQQVLGTIKATPTTTASTDVDLPQKFSVVDPQNPNKTLYSVENGIVKNPNKQHIGVLEPRAGRTGAYYLLKGIGILTKNGKTWYLKDKQNGKWITIGVLKTEN